MNNTIKFLFIFILLCTSVSALTLEEGIELNPSSSNVNYLLGTNLSPDNLTINQYSISFDNFTITIISDTNLDVIIHNISQNYFRWRENQGANVNRSFCLFSPNISIQLVEDYLTLIKEYESDTNGCLESNASLDSNKLYILQPKGQDNKGLIPKDFGTPFYTLQDNPLSCGNLSFGETCNLTWSINATGELNTSYIFYILARDYGYTPVKSNEVNITIHEETPPENDLIFNLSQIYQNTTLNIFRFIINNTINSSNNFTWQFNTGEGLGSSIFNSSYEISLNNKEANFVYVEHNYTNSGSYNVTATTFTGNLSDSETIEVTIP